MPPAAKAAGNKPAPKKRKKAGAYKMPDPLPAGEVLTDLTKKQWSLGSSVGKGGFGEIYIAYEMKDGKPQGEPSHVIKIEPHENGPLFCELHFYQRAAKPDIISAWKKAHKLKHLGVPNFIASGQHDFKGKKYRFLVMERFGEDLWNIFVKSGRKFAPKVAFTIGIQLVDALEYLHAQGYVHADIKGSNILLGFEPKAKDQVFLVDFGLAAKYMPGNVHREYTPDPKKAHDGTLEFTSIGAHEGVSPARRHDFEILGYNLVQWMTGSLPWAHLTNEVEVQLMKVENSKKRTSFLQLAFKEENYPTVLNDYFNYVDKLPYEAEPNYTKIKELFKKGITSAGGRFDGKLQFETVSKDTAKASKTPRRQSPRKTPAKEAKVTPGARNVKPVKNAKKSPKRYVSSSEDEETPVMKKTTNESKDSAKASKTARKQSPGGRARTGKPVKNTKKNLKRYSDSSKVEEAPAKKRTKRTSQTEESSSEAEPIPPERKKTQPRKAAASMEEEEEGGPRRRGGGDDKSGAAGRKVTNQSKSRGSTRVKKRLVASVSAATQTSPGLRGLKRTRKKTGK